MNLHTRIQRLLRKLHVKDIQKNVGLIDFDLDYYLPEERVAIRITDEETLSDYAPNERMNIAEEFAENGISLFHFMEREIEKYDILERIRLAVNGTTIETYDGVIDIPYVAFTLPMYEYYEIIDHEMPKHFVLDTEKNIEIFDSEVANYPDLYFSQLRNEPLDKKYISLYTAGSLRVVTGMRDTGSEFNFI